MPPNYSYVPPQPQDLVKITSVEDGIPSPFERFVKLGGLPASAGLVVTDGTRTVTNPTTIDFITNATVSNSGSGVASVAVAAGGGTGTVYGVVAGAGLLDGSTPGGTITNFGTLNMGPASTASIGGVFIGSGVTVDAGGTISVGGGGGGSYVGGLGIGIVTNSGTGTISNTGDIVLPAAVGTANGVGILMHAAAGSGTAGSSGGYLSFESGRVSSPGTASPVKSGGIYIQVGYVVISNSAGSGSGGYLIETAGEVFRGGLEANPARLKLMGGSITSAGTVTGGTANLYGGSAASGGTNIGGNVNIAPGSAATMGVLLVSNIGTVDPHVLNAKWQTSVAGVGFVGVYSKG